MKYNFTTYHKFGNFKKQKFTFTKNRSIWFPFGWVEVVLSHYLFFLLLTSLWPVCYSKIHKSVLPIHLS